MNYLINRISCDDHNNHDVTWYIIDILNVSGCIFIEAQCGNCTKVINIRDIYFNHTFMHENNVFNSEHNINWIYACSDPLNNYRNDRLIVPHNGSSSLKFGRVTTNSDGATYQDGSTITKIHMYNVHFMIPRWSYYELYRYPLLDLVWHDIWIYLMMILHMTIMPDIQKIIQMAYLMLVNNTLQPSFKLF